MSFFGTICWASVVVYETVKWFLVFMGMVFVALTWYGIEDNKKRVIYEHLNPIYEQSV